MTHEKYILLVDDEDVCHFLARRVLSGLEFDGNIAEVNDGIEACDYIKAHGSPALVLLDLRMPIMSGNEFLELLDKGDLGVPPSVCVLTSSARPEDQQLDHEYAFVKTCFEKPLLKSSLGTIGEILECG